MMSVAIFSVNVSSANTYTDLPLTNFSGHMSWAVSIDVSNFE